MNRYNFYRGFILNNIPNLLSHLDRDKNSPTSGCFDRNYWHYLITDFPSMIVQQGSLVLALLYLNKFEGNIYYKNKKVKEWTLVSFDFWKNAQLKDGSFNEYYPNEHGFPPTVFSLYTISESYRLLKENKIIPKKYELEEALIKSAKFVYQFKERNAINQEIAGVAALYSVYLCTGKKEILNQVKNKLNSVLCLQSEEGWFTEYGGTDIGYLSVSLYFLSEYYRLSNDEKVIPNIKKIIDFVKYFVHPNGTIGGEYGSRNTQYFLPGGLETAGGFYPPAIAIAEKLFGGINNNFSRSIDERYISHYVLHSFLRALIDYNKRLPKIRLPNEKRVSKYFKDSGIYVYNDNYYSVLNLSKGGVLKVFKNNKEIFTDCGYCIKKGSKFYITNWVGSDFVRKFDPFNKILTTSGYFYSTNYYVPNSFRHFLIRILSKLVGPRLIVILKKQLLL